MGLVGLGVAGYGLWGVIKPGEVKVEIVKGGKSSDHLLAQGTELGQQAQIVVDVAGAVERPGVYKLPGGSRIGDALVAAGGLSASADREWVAKTLNLAKEIKDQEKIYIPVYKETPLPAQAGSQSKGKGVTLPEQQERVNINTASVGELDSLAGIGLARAQAIVDNRPYGSTEELVSKARIPQSVYDKIKANLSIY